MRRSTRGACICKSERTIIGFFFEQKTAYEMRISDWSSDVCSSDLPAALGVDMEAMRARRRQPVEIGDQQQALRCVAGGDGAKVAADAIGREDRKSVVEGKSVSVRVDLGGRSNIKKKILS